MPHHVTHYENLKEKINYAAKITADIDSDREAWNETIKSSIDFSGPMQSVPPASTIPWFCKLVKEDKPLTCETRIKLLVNKFKKKKKRGELVSSEELAAFVNDLSDVIKRSKRDDALNNAIQELTLIINYAYDIAQSEYGRCYSLLNSEFSDQKEFAPTSFGNVGLIAQGYASSAFSCNLALIWSALRRVASKDDNSGTGEALENTKSQLDFLVAGFWLTLIFAIQWSFIFAFNGKMIPALICSFAGPVVCLLWYSAAVEQYRVLQDLVISILNTLIFTRFYGHTAKRVISNFEVTNENQERRRRPI